MKGTVLSLLCAITLAQATQPQLTLSGKVCNCNAAEASSVCSKNGSDNELIVHENCNQFYKCSNGVPIAYFCPDTTLYNPIAEICDWPYNVQCGERPVVAPGTGAESEDCSEENTDSGNGEENNGGNDNGNDSTCNCNPEEAPALCAADGSDGVLVAHQNCNQFYKCDHGVPVALNCPPGLLYNPVTEQCDWANSVDCGDRPIVEIDGGDNGDSGNNESGNGNADNDGGGDNGGDGTCNCNPGEAPGICAADGSDGVLVAHENCNQFYKCDHGVPVALNCPSGLLYNPVIEQCDWANNVDCGDRPIVEIESGGDNGGDVDCEDDGGSESDNGNGESGSGGGNGDNGGGDNGGGTCNCNPGEAPGICAADGSDGVLVAHENCNQFYKCAHGVPVALNCYDGLVFNPFTDQCDWPENVDCGDRPIVEIEGGGGGNGGEGGDSGNGDSGSGGGNGDNGGGDNGDGTCNCYPGEAPGICAADGSDGTLVAHENCNQFYKCNNGVPVTMNCPMGLVYNPYIECCDWPYNVECGDKPIVEIDGGGNGESGGGNGNGDGNGDNGGGGSENSNEDNSGTCNCNPEDAPGICTADGSDGILVAHENCNQFYKCSQGTPVTMNCPPGLVYNPYIECCDWPANVNCGDKPIVEVEGGGNGDNGGGGGGDGDNGSGGGSAGGNSNEENGSTCNCDPGEAPGICAADGSDGVLVAHENCNQFYKCTHGVPIALNCYGGLFYNPITQQCDWPDLVDCGDRNVDIDGGDNGGTDNGGTDNGGTDNGGNDNGGSDNGGTDNGGTDNGGTDNGGTDGGGTCNCNPGEAPGICAADGSDGVLVAHENCNQFYKCAHGVPVALYCNEGLLYNPITQQCDWSFNVDCGDRPIVEGGGSDNGGTDNGGTDNGGTDNGGTDNGGTDNGGTDNGGTDGGGTCNCNPGEAPGICAADGSDGVLVAHENCNQFYKCAHGVPVALYCNEGLLYNPITQQCDWSFNVDCGDRPIVEGGGSDNGGTDNGGTDNGGTDNGGTDNGGTDNGGTDNGGTDNGGTDGGGTCNCNPGEAPGICAADGSDGVLVAHENCNQFYKCAHGVPVALYCNEGLLYNPITQQCDWSFNVDCGDRPIVEGGGSDNGGTDNGGTDNGGIDNGGTDNGGTDNGGTDNGGTDNGGTDNGGTDNGGTDNGGADGGGTCNCNPGEAPGICAADGSDGVLVAHENCNQFYKCAHGVPVALYCNEGLLYNPVTQQCDWSFNVDCGDRPIVEGGGNDNGGTDNGGTDNGGTDNGGTDNGGTDNGGTDNGGTDNGGTDGGGTCNCNPGEAPGICAADGSDGVLVAHENCNQFYKCAHGVPVALYCNEGLLYNPITQQCDWSFNVDCGDRPIVEGGGNDNGGTDNGGTDNGGTDNGGTDNGGTDNGGTDNGGTDNGGTDGGGTCNCNPGEAPGICAADGSDGVLVAHENCNQFYKCAHGVPVALYCNEGLLYNPITQQCDWSFNVDCGDRPIVEGGGNDNGGTDNGGTDNGGTDNGGTDNGGTDNGGTDNGGTDGGGTCNCNPGEAPGICAADGSDGVLVAHENCNQFYKCANGVPVALYCNEGLLYNPYTEQCDWPFNVDCGNRPIVEGGGTDNGGTDNGATDNGGTDNGGTDNGGTDNGGTDEGGNDNEGGTCNCNPDEASGICAAGGSDGTLVAHENCNQYYVCAHGLPVCQFCPGNLLYNPYSGRCDWPHLVECGNRPIVENEGGSEDNGGGDSGDGDNGDGDNGSTCNCDPNEAPSICSAGGSDGTLVAHENCNQFYTCAHGVPVPVFCSGNLLYNPIVERCDWPSVVECGNRPIVEPEGGEDNGDGDNGGVGGGCDNNEGTCDPGQAPAICGAAGSDGILVSHENCNQYYVCLHGQPLAMDCPSNLLYNPKIRDCDWPYNVDCGDRVIPEPEIPDGPCACYSREAPSICAGSGSNGKLIAHENCNKYYVCFEGTPVARSCPRALFYDPHTEQCLWPASVSCEGRAITTYSSHNKHAPTRRGFF